MFTRQGGDVEPLVRAHALNLSSQSIFVRGMDTSSFFVAARAMGRVLFIIIVGCTAAHNKLLDKPTRSKLAQLNLKVFFPSLFLSVAGHYNVHDLIRYAPLCVASVLHITLGFAIASLAAKATQLSRADRTFLVIMTAFGNTTGLPFVLMQAVCVSWPKVADEPDPIGRAFVIIQLYGLPWSILAFTLGKSTIARSVQEEPLAQRDLATRHGVTRRPRAPSFHLEALDTDAPPDAHDILGSRSAATPPASIEVAWSAAASAAGRVGGEAWAFLTHELSLTAAVSSVALACTEPLKALCFHGGPLDFIGGGLQMLGRCSPPISTLVMASGLYSVYVTLAASARGRTIEGDESAPLPPCMLIALASLLKLLVLPALCFPVTLYVMHRGCAGALAGLRLMEPSEKPHPPSAKPLPPRALCHPSAIPLPSLCRSPCRPLVQLLLVSGASDGWLTTPWFGSSYSSCPLCRALRHLSRSCSRRLAPQPLTASQPFTCLSTSRPA